MNWYKEYKTAKKQKKDFFDYENLAKDNWRELIYEKQKECNINFDLENEMFVDHKSFKMKATTETGQENEYSVKAELWEGCGDWENPIYYVRLQCKAYGSPESHVIIPKENNPNLEKNEDGLYMATHNGGGAENKIDEVNMKDLWKEVEEYLKKTIGGVNIELV